MAKILIIEDEPRIAELTKEVLTTRGYEVRIAPTGKEALVIYFEEYPDIVLLDLGLPDINGRQILRDIKSRTPKTKIVVISGYPDEDTKKEVMGLGADYFLTKPVYPPKFYELLEHISGKEE